MAHLPPLRTLAAALGVALIGAQAGTPATAQTAPPTIVSGAPPSAMPVPPLPQRTDGRQSYIVTFAEAGLLHYRGGVHGLAATAKAADAPARKFDAHSPAAAAYGAYLATTRDAHVAAIRSALGRALDVTHSYAITRSGIAVDLSPTEAARVERLPDVAKIEAAGYEHFSTLRGPTFIGADQVWNGNATPDHAGSRGEGIVVGVLDTGADASHPSFANDPACGFDAAHPKMIAVDCTRSDAGRCTGPDPLPVPGFGHGMHTASTLAGNAIDNTVTPAPALPDGVHMSGVAPCAAIRQYKVCASYWCGSDWILAGTENAIADQVDVLNVSLTGGYSPWSDDDRRFLDATDAGIFVAAAAGNFAPPYSVAHQGPWMTSVAATTQDEILVPALAVTGPGTPPADLASIPLIPTSATRLTRAALTGKPLRSYAGDPCAAMPAGTFTGAIAVFVNGSTVAGGACTIAAIAAHAVDAGAIAVVVDKGDAFATAPWDTTGAPDVPVYETDWALAVMLDAFIAAHPADATATIRAPAATAIPGDRVAIYNMSGPLASPLQEETKPDLGAPGFAVYAALEPLSGNYGLDFGTSMAAPHVAGAGALVRSVHPDWTPTEIKSALMTTAADAGTRTAIGGWEPWTSDVAGNGRVDVARAVAAGLTLDETYANFLAADPSTRTLDIRQLNVPSLRNTECAAAGCTWTRRVTNRLAQPGTWAATFRNRYGDATVSVDPPTFTLAPGATQTLTITALPSATDSANMAFGDVVLGETAGAAPEQHLGVSVKPLPAPLPATLCDDAGACTLEVDNYRGRGMLAALSFQTSIVTLWLNAFTPAASDYPFVLKDVRTFFLGNHDGFVFNTPGSLFDVYVYQDDDGDPSNGATLVAAITNVAVTAPMDAFQTIPMPGDGIRLDGPGDVLVALSWHGATAPNLPMTVDGVEYPLARGRSWINTVPIVAEDTLFADGFDGRANGPDLAHLGMQNLDVIRQSAINNFVIRADGVRADGNAVEWRRQ